MVHLLDFQVSVVISTESDVEGGKASDTKISCLKRAVKYDILGMAHIVMRVLLHKEEGTYLCYSGMHA